MTAPARATDRLDLADDLRNLAACAGEGADIDRELRRTLTDIPEPKRAVVERFVRLWADIIAGHASAVEEYMAKEPGTLDSLDRVAVWRRVALDSCARELQDVIDLALHGWTVWAVVLRTGRASEMWPGLTRSVAEAKAARARDMGGEVNVTFVACAPGQTPAVAA